MNFVKDWKYYETLKIFEKVENSINNRNLYKNPKLYFTEDQKSCKRLKLYWKIEKFLKVQEFCKKWEENSKTWKFSKIYKILWKSS